MHVNRGDVPSGLSKRESHLYSIVGCYDQENRGLTAMAFGGYFRFDVLENLVLNGQLIDALGPSTIEGQMTDDELMFKKQYASSFSGGIDYQFVKQNGLWVGEWRAESDSGKAECKTVLIYDDAFSIACGAPQR